jgi:hypothetical protein
MVEENLSSEENPKNKKKLASRCFLYTTNGKVKKKKP